MNKRTTSTITTRLRWGAFFLVLLFLVIQVMPRALGQRGQQDISKRTSDVETPSDLDSGTWTTTGSLNTANSDSYCDANPDAYTYAGRDHAQRHWL